VNERGPARPAGLLYGLATGLAEALTAIHGGPGIVHRDLKPSNVLAHRDRTEGHRTSAIAQGAGHEQPDQGPAITVRLGPG